MKARNASLALLLAAQLVLAGGLYWGSLHSADEFSPEPLLHASAGEIDRLVISSGEKTAELVRVDGNWQLPAVSGLPADAARVATALERLEAASTHWPVTTTAASHARFEVADKDFQRRIQVYAGDTPVAGFYLGTSPGYRQAHLRDFDQDEVYAVQMNVSDFPAGDSDWLDKNLLAVPGPQRIEAVDFAIAATGDGAWELAQAGDPRTDSTPELDGDRAAQLAAALENLRVQALADEAAAPEEADPETSRTLHVETADGTLDYRFFALDGKYYVTRDDLGAIFSLSKYEYDRIAGVGLAELAAQGTAQDAKASGQEGQVSEPLGASSQG